jgi:hypothetical protein
VASQTPGELDCSKMMGLKCLDCENPIATLSCLWCCLGLDHFDDFRFFHFFTHDHIIDGVREQIGVFQCKSSVVAKTWHDTRGDTTKVIFQFLNVLSRTIPNFILNCMLCFQIFHVHMCKLQFIPLFKDPNQKLDYHSFWNVPGKIPPYLVAAQDANTIRQLQDSLDFCTPRIQRTRTPEVQHCLDSFIPVIAPTKFTSTCSIFF